MFFILILITFSNTIISVELASNSLGLNPIIVGIFHCWTIFWWIILLITITTKFKIIHKRDKEYLAYNEKVIFELGQYCIVSVILEELDCLNNCSCSSKSFDITDTLDSIGDSFDGGFGGD